MWPAAATAALLLAACETNHAAIPSTNTPTPSVITTWQQWGKHGQQLLAKCGENEWACIGNAGQELDLAMKQLPESSDGDIARHLLSNYRDDLRSYIQHDCAEGRAGSAERAAKCAIANQRLPMNSKAVRAFVDRVAAG